MRWLSKVVTVNSAVPVSSPRARRFTAEGLNSPLDPLWTPSGPPLDPLLTSSGPVVEPSSRLRGGGAWRLCR
eukprot:983387-Prorocentrum_minimum.AAC.2